MSNRSMLPSPTVLSLHWVAAPKALVLAFDESRTYPALVAKAEELIIKLSVLGAAMSRQLSSGCVIVSHQYSSIEDVLAALR